MSLRCRTCRGSSTPDQSFYAALLVPAGRAADRFGLKGNLRRRPAHLHPRQPRRRGKWRPVGPDPLPLPSGRRRRHPHAVQPRPRPRHRPSGKVRQHVQVSTVSGSISGALGPVVVGLLVEASWRWIFLLNLPIGALRLIPRITREEDARIPDLIGGGLLILGIGSLALGLVQGTDWGWGSSRVVSSFVVAAVAVGLVRRHSPCAVGGTRHRRTVGSLGIATRAQDR